MANESSHKQKLGREPATKELDPEQFGRAKRTCFILWMSCLEEVEVLMATNLWIN